MSEAPQSPCISICALDQNDVCEGAFARVTKSLIGSLPTMRASERSLRLASDAAKSLDLHSSSDLERVQTHHLMTLHKVVNHASFTFSVASGVTRTCVIALPSMHSI